MSLVWRFHCIGITILSLKNRILPEKNHFLVAVVVEFQPNSYIVNENEGMVRFILVKRTQSARDVTVHLSTVDGSAKSGVHLQ